MLTAGVISTFSYSALPVTILNTLDLLKDSV